jgi:hypothetical protein
LKLPTFLHVVDSAGQADTLHPFQGALPVLKLVEQPSMQLVFILSSLAILAKSESGIAEAV